MNIGGYIPESINEGLGLRAVIFVSGCRHYCKGCHNPESWNFKYGAKFDDEKQIEIINSIKSNPLLDGVTFVGGDPFFSAKDVSDFIERLKKEVPHLNIWTYTGFTFEELIELNDKEMIRLLSLSDVLVDGRYVEKERDLSLPFRGSRNQRIIKVKESLNDNKVVEFEEF